MRYWRKSGICSVYPSASPWGERYQGLVREPAHAQDITADPDISFDRGPIHLVGKDERTVGSLEQAAAAGAAS